MTATERRIGYLVSRFPLVTETFILRELDAIDQEDGLRVELFSLFAGDETTVHDEARRWLPKVHRASKSRVLGSFLYWSIRRPRTLAKLLKDVISDYWASPRLLAKSVVTLLLACRHAQTAERLGVEHLHAHFATYPALAAMVISSLTGASYSITPHAHDIYVDQRGLRRKSRSASFVVAVSRYNWMFLQHFGAAPARLPIIRYGLDLTEYAFRPRSIPTTGVIDAVVVSSFKPYKGHQFLVDAIASDPALTRLTVEFIGDGPLRQHIETLVRHRGVEEQCRFSGSRDQAYIRARLSNAHLLVQPSIVQEDGDTEGLPNTLIEATAAGVIAIGTGVTGVPELIEDGVTGFIAEPASSTSLAKALRRAMDGAEDAGRIQAAARARAEANHELGHTVAALVSWFAKPRSQ